ncbi:hypothetical protein OJE16_03495 [Pantoea tagorei]
MTYQPLIAEVHNQQHTLTAIVEQDERTAYFYIWPTDLFRSQYAVRGCWLRNLLPAPAQEDRAAMEQGIAPLLSAEYCRTLEAEPPLDPAGLQVLWEPSDDGAALWYYGQLLAVIPGWSLYQDKQVSFSAGCIKKKPAHRAAGIGLHQRLLRACGTSAPVLARLARRQRVGSGAAGADAALSDAVRRVGEILRHRPGQLAADGHLSALASGRMVFPYARHEHSSDAAGRLSV